MGPKSQTNYDQPRDKQYSGYTYQGKGKWLSTECKRRGKKTGNCYEWNLKYLNESKPEDEAILKTMILINEGEL